MIIKWANDEKTLVKGTDDNGKTFSASINDGNIKAWLAKGGIPLPRYTPEEQAKIDAEKAEIAEKKSDVLDLISQLKKMDFSKISSADDMKAVMVLHNKILLHLCRTVLERN